MKKIIKVSAEYDGCEKGDKKEKDLIKIFNTVKPNGYTARVSDPWCAIAISAWAIKAYGKDVAKKYLPLSASVPDMQRKARNMGLWLEDDKTVPIEGDWILYDWQDSGLGDNTGSPDHVGLVIKAGKTSFCVREGNKGSQSICGIRWMDVGGRYIRGFIRPRYRLLTSGKDYEDRVSRLADDVIKGKYGNGAERRKKLGSDYEAVQAEVNRRLKK